VFSPQVGIHNNIVVFDFKSLYPSIIRTFNIDPLAMVLADDRPDSDLIITRNDARFDRKRGILPGMLDIFFERRAKAQADEDALASYTYKIVMNSFYGVLGSHTCKFSSSRLAGAITHTGHYLLHWSKELLEKHHCKVLYGDTDSLFVDAQLPEDISYDQAFAKGAELCALINAELAEHLKQEYGVESRLELEFEKIYRKLLLPPMRAQETRGRAKGYAGLMQKNETETELQIVGMEAVRRDWTNLSHQFQKDLFTLLFTNASGNDIEEFIFSLVHEIRSGAKDDQLVYRKALRKPVESYVKTTPPHVKAARMLPNPPGVIHYLMTIDGPQPVSLHSSPIDYTHYIDKQIKPIIETIASFCDVDVNAALTGQQRLF
jgi:DNA polymerase-2